MYINYVYPNICKSMIYLDKNKEIDIRIISVSTKMHREIDVRGREKKKRCKRKQ